MVLPKLGNHSPVLLSLKFLRNLAILIFLNVMVSLALAGTWSDNFEGAVLGPQWRGDRDNFSILDGALRGFNAHPVMLFPPRWVEVGKDWDNYVVQCRVNVVEPNMLVCTKGALILRRSGKEGYVFALHVATGTVEVYRLSDGEMLLSKEEPLELKKWYQMRAELQGDNMSFYLDDKLIGKLTDKRSGSGAAGLAVQDVLSVLFDDFTITGPRIDSGAAGIKAGNKVTTLWARIKTVSSP